MWPWTRAVKEWEESLSKRQLRVLRTVGVSVAWVVFLLTAVVLPGLFSSVVGVLMMCVVGAVCSALAMALVRYAKGW